MGKTQGSLDTAHAVPGTLGAINALSELLQSPGSGGAVSGTPNKRAILSTCLPR